MAVTRCAPSLLLLLATACGAGPEGSAKPAPEPGERNPLVGTRADLSALRWLEPRTAPDLTENRLTLLRWWTVECPFCRDSLPDLAALRQRFAPRGLDVVGVFHPKSPRVPADTALVDYARTLGFAGAIAADDRWLALADLRGRGGLDEATSISVLLDGEGVVRWVHPGPRLHRSDDPALAAAQRSFQELERVLEGQLPAAPR